MGGYGRLRAVMEEENGGKWRNGREKVGENPKTMTEMSLVKCRVWSVEWKV